MKKKIPIRIDGNVNEIPPKLSLCELLLNTYFINPRSNEENIPEKPTTISSNVKFASVLMMLYVNRFTNRWYGKEEILEKVRDYITDDSNIAVFLTKILLAGIVKVKTYGDIKDKRVPRYYQFDHTKYTYPFTVISETDIDLYPLEPDSTINY